MNLIGWKLKHLVEFQPNAQQWYCVSLASFFRTRRNLNHFYFSTAMNYEFKLINKSVISPSPGMHTTRQRQEWGDASSLAFRDQAELCGQKIWFLLLRTNLVASLSTMLSGNIFLTILQHKTRAARSFRVTNYLYWWAKTKQSQEHLLKTQNCCEYSSFKACCLQHPHLLCQEKKIQCHAAGFAIQISQGSFWGLKKNHMS